MKTVCSYHRRKSIAPENELFFVTRADNYNWSCDQHARNSFLSSLYHGGWWVMGGGLIFELNGGVVVNECMRWSGDSKSIQNRYTWVAENNGALLKS